MPVNTPNLGIPKPLGNEYFNRASFNNILDTIDTAFKQKLDAAITGILNGAPGALDTLKELADALGDDPNFSITILNNIGLLSDLETTAKDNLVHAINELKQNLDEHQAEEASLTNKGHVQVGSGINVDVNGVISHPTGDGNSHVPATSTTNNGKVLTAGATANSASWQALPPIITKAQGSFKDTTTLVAYLATYTKTIPLGITATRGRLIINSTPPIGFYTERGAIVFFNTVQAQTTGIRFDSSVNNIRLTKAYISGANLILEFYNPSSETNLGVGNCVWEVES